MASKIALHCHRAGPDIDAAISSAPWAAVKALNDSAPLATARAHGIPVRILRLYGIETLSDSDAVNRWLQQDLSAASHLQLVCEDGKGYDAQWQGAIINGLRPHFGGTFLIGGFPTGNPKDYDSKDHTKSDGTWTHADGTPHFPALLPLVPLLQHPDVALGVDEYTSILSTDPRWNGELEWMPARYELLHHCLELHGASPNVVILESGADDGEPAPSKTGSWTGRGWSAADYLTTLEALDSLDQQAPYVVCRCVFTLGAPNGSQWQPYDIDSIIPQLAAYVTGQQEGAQMPTTATPGFDVSSYQGQIDWGRASAAARFAGIKTSEGVYPNGVPLVDQYGAQNMAAAKANGLLRLPYHFGHPDLGNDPIAEADAYLNTANLQPGDVPVLDIEVPAPNLPLWAKLWLDRVASKTGARPVLYTYLSYVQQYFQGTTALAQYPLWLADYISATPAAPMPWGTLPLWQYGSAGSVPGIAGSVDVDVALVDLATIAAFGVPQASTPSTGGTDVPTGANTTAAAKTRWEALGVGANPATAIFAAYASRCAAWIASGQQPVLDPTPCVHAETSTPDGHAYAAFDNGEVYDYHQADGKVYLAEVKDRAAIFAACGWGQA